MNDKEKLTEIRRIAERAFAEDADKYEADKHYALEEILRVLD